MERDDVDLIGLGEADFSSFFERIVDEYARQSVAAGRVAEKGAREWARSESEKLLPDGALTRGALLFRIVSKQDPKRTVGSIWCGEDPGNPTNAFVYDLFVYPEHRGQGFAFAAMSKLETILRAKGYESVGLHVYAHNDAAMKLYHKLRYRATAVVMRKSLS